MGILFKDIRAVLPTEGRSFEVKKVSVYVQGDKISTIGRAPEGFTADEVVDGSGKLLIPGLINAHTHVYMTVFRNFADDLDFMDWLFGKIQPMEDRLTPEDCYWGTLLGYMEMLATGTTCSLDMYIHTEAAARAQQDAGVRAVMSRGLAGGESDVSSRRAKLKRAVDEINGWKGSDGLSFMLGPHAPYTCDGVYLKEIVDAADELGTALNIHVSESLDEMRTIREKYGATPPEYLDSFGVLRHGTVCAHCVHLTDSDMELMAARGVSVASNPVSNLKLANGIAPVPKMLKAGLNVAIGTDGAASNNSLNMFRDMGFMALVHKGMSGDPKAVSASEAFYMATAGGAKALGLEGITGEIKEGLKADLVVLDIDKPWIKPDNSIISALAYSVNGSEVEKAYVGGRLLYDRGKFTTIDADRAAFEIEKTCERIGMR